MRQVWEEASLPKRFIAKELRRMALCHDMGGVWRSIRSTSQPETLCQPFCHPFRQLTGA